MHSIHRWNRDVCVRFCRPLRDLHVWGRIPALSRWAIFGRRGGSPDDSRHSILFATLNHAPWPTEPEPVVIPHPLLTPMVGFSFVLHNA
jgi:hypothetical protein